MALKASIFFITRAEDTWPSLRSSGIVVQRAYKPSRDPQMDTAGNYDQYLYAQARVPWMKSGAVILQYAIQAPEEYVTDLIYPELIGLAWETGMKPMFSTKVAQHTSGRETRTQFWEDPRWDFNLNYDYLPNREAGVTDLKRLLGFFLQCGGSFETFLFKAPDFHTVTNQQLLVGNGVITEVDLIQDINGYIMPVGYVDAASLVLKQTQTQNIVASGTTITLPLPYGATIALVKQGITTITPTGGAPTGNQYSFDPALGELTINASRSGQTFAVTYTAQLRPAIEYSIVFPRTVVLNTATPTGGILVGTYEYYFTCRFPDEMDFSQFSDKLWNLQEIEFRSTIE